MNKFILYITFFFSVAVFGQSDSISVVPELVEEVEFTSEQDVHPKKFREHFQNDYRTEDFVYEAVVKDTSKWDRFKQWLAYWLDRIFSFGGEGDSSIWGIAIKTIAVLVVLFVVYLIVKAILNKEGKWIFGKSSKKKIITSEIHEEDIHAIDFKVIIEKSKQADNYRLSIRYYYLWLLKKMSDNGIIEWDIEKTNTDYLYEINRQSLKDDFQYLSYIYDYSWYGEFVVDQILFEKAEKAFIKTINSL
ncbi:DUF4129 domain-containing protein [Flavobacterium enshiense]